MDLNETTEEVLYRHPWELSRTQCILKVLSSYIDKLDGKGRNASYINVGAGDLYFDKELLKKYIWNQVYAVDTAYKDIASEDKRIHKYHYLEDIEVKVVDYALMMDSLEYMEDDVKYVRKMAKKIKKGGFFFFTLPAHPFLFSDHDRNVKICADIAGNHSRKFCKGYPNLKKQKIIIIIPLFLWFDLHKKFFICQ